MTHRNRNFRSLWLLGASLVVALLVAEGLLWLLYPLQYPFRDSLFVRHYIRHEHEPRSHRVTVPEAGLPGVHGINHWTINNLGFRGDDLARPKPANEYRIFIIGGSTAECAVLDDAESLEAVVQSALQRRLGHGTSIRVYNAGVSGDRSDDHIAMLTQRIVHLEPDLLVVFAGINDLRAGIAGHDYLHFPTPARTVWKLAAAKPQLGRLAYYTLKGRPPWKLTDAGEPVETMYRFAVGLQRDASLVTDLPEPDIRAYADNLRTLAGVSLGHDIPMVFMTQQSTWASAIDPRASDWHWLLRVGDVRYPEEAMDTALKRMNDAMRAVAEAADVPVYDLASDIPKSLEYFYDDVHFNTNGAAFAGEALADVIAGTIVEQSP